MPELSFRLILQTDDASGKLRNVAAESDALKGKIEEGKIFRISAEQALGTIRDVKIAVDGVVQVIQSVTAQLNGLMEAGRKQRDAMTLTTLAFGAAAIEMSKFASSMQSVTNFGDDDLLPLMAKMAMTYKLNKDEVQELTPVLLDFAEANKATGMTVETAYDLMGRALNGHTEMLGRYGIELDKNRIATEGVSYLVQKLGADYGGTAEALANLRIQNANTWGDVKEEIGTMIEEMIMPVLRGLKLLMEGYNSLTPAMKGFVAGIGLAIPIIGTATTAIITMTAAIKALHIAINPVVGVIGLAVSVLAGLGFALAASKAAHTDAIKTQKDYQGAVKTSVVTVEQLIEKHRQISDSIDYVAAKQRIKELDMAMKEYNETLYESLAATMLTREERDQMLNEMIKAAREADALRTKVAGDDSAARKKYKEEAKRIEEEIALNGVSLMEYKLAREKEYYSALGAVRADNVDEQIQTLERIRSLEKQITDEKQRELDQRAKDDEEAVKDKLALEQEKFRSEIEYMSNLQELGVASYDQLKKTMEDYYAWAKENMSKEEQAMILIQLRQANLRWGEYRQREAEEEWNRLRGLAETRDEFRETDLRLSENTYALQLFLLEQYYESRRGIMRAAGISELDIETQIAKAKEELRKAEEKKWFDAEKKMRQDIVTASALFGEKGFKVAKMFAQTQAVIDTYASANAAYKAMAGIPVVGPALGFAAAAAAIAAGLANVVMIEKQEYAPKMADGGMLFGPSHRNGGVLIEAEGDEYITAKDRVRAFGKKFFDFVNFAPIDQVRNAFAGMSIPNIPLPDNGSGYFAQGGSVSSRGSDVYGIFEAMNDKLGKLLDKNMVFDIHVDPLSNDPVKVSEISDTGKIIRGAV